MATRLASPGPARWCPRPSAVTPDASCAGRTPNCPAESCRGANAVPRLPFPPPPPPQTAPPEAGSVAPPGPARSSGCRPPPPPSVSLRRSHPTASAPEAGAPHSPVSSAAQARAHGDAPCPGGSGASRAGEVRSSEGPPVPHTGRDPTGPRRLCGPPAPFRAGGCSRVPFWGTGGGHCGTGRSLCWPRCGQWPHATEACSPVVARAARGTGDSGGAGVCSPGRSCSRV